MPERLSLYGSKLGMNREEARLATALSDKILLFAYEAISEQGELEEGSIIGVPEWAAKCGMETGLGLACNIAANSYIAGEATPNVLRLMSAARTAIIEEIDAINKEQVERN